MSVSIIADYMGEDELHILGDNKKRQQYAQVMNLQHLMYQCRKHYPSDLMIHREVLSPMVLRELCTDFSLSYSQDSVIELYEHIEHYASLPIFLSAEAQSLIRALYGAWCYEKYKREHNSTSVYLSKKFNVPVSTIKQWLRGVVPDSNDEDELNEYCSSAFVAQLIKENQRLRMENDVLKKAEASIPCRKSIATKS